ncbi:hypothetical protein BGX34_005965 [Mortierella sp. NVP85]|nr:hypothetical protein BGX34_005965 [Mortierella sp. NVP85]
MSTKPDPTRATPPTSASRESAPLAPIAQAHHQPQEHVVLPLRRLEISSGRSSTSAPGYDLSSVPLPFETTDYRGGHSPFIPDLPVSDSNTYTGRPVLDTSRRYSSGYTTLSQSTTHPNPASASSTLASKRLSRSGGQAPTITPALESPSAGQKVTSVTAALKSPSSGFYTFAPDFLNSPHEVDNHQQHNSTLSSVPHSPAFSISSFSGIIPSSNSISSVNSTTQPKHPTLDHKQPITVKDFDSILILGSPQLAAIKTLCSNRVLSRIDTIGWYSILGGHKFPAIISSQDAYDIEMATTCMAIEFGVNNSQTHNFNTLVLQLLSQLKLIKDQDYKGDIPSHAYNALFLTRIFLNHFISHLSSAELVSFFEGSDLPAEAQQEALGIVSFKGCKLGVDQALVADPRPYAEQLIQGVIGVILNLDVESSPSAYEFYEETLNLIIVMASTQLQLPTSEPSEKNYFLNLTLQNFSAYNYLFTKAGSSPSSEAHPIADRSILVLLLLHSQAKGNHEWESFRRSVQNLRDEHGVEGKTNYSQVYVLLVILLLFSQDEVFNENIQKITMTYQPWFTERLLKSISLGGLAIAIVIRTIQYNLAQHKDVYFHTNSLAILANMSSSLQDIHPYVSQRLVTLFDIVARRYQKLVNKQTQLDENVDKNADVIIYGDMVTLVLEIINSTLTHKLKANPQLVYSLLHKQEMFAYFRNDPRFKDLIQNIEQALNYFQQKVSEANIRAPTPDEVAQVIQTASRTWPPNLMKTFPDIKFEYEEEEQANEFFCPYVWSLLYRNTFVYWDEEKAKILHDYRTVVNDETAFEGVPVGNQATVIPP